MTTQAQTPIETQAKQTRYIGDFRGEYAGNAVTLFNGLLYYTDATREQAHAASVALMSDAANNNLKPGTLEVGKASKDGKVTLKLGKGESVKGLETYALALNRLITSIDKVKRSEAQSVEIQSFKGCVTLSVKMTDWMNEKWRIQAETFNMQD